MSICIKTNASIPQPSLQRSSAMLTTGEPRLQKRQVERQQAVFFVLA
jgi:hypothetical protein